jgi:TPR repeat protein
MNENNNRGNAHEIASELFDQRKFKEAFQEYCALANDESITGQLMVGWMYHSGLGVEQNLEKAQQWYQKAANANSSEGEFYLGALYRSKQQYPQAVEWLTKSAAQKYMPAIYRLGKMYDIGEGVNKDHAKAYKYLEQAASMGHLFAKREIAVKMIKGHSGAINILKGVFMFIQVLFAGVRTISIDPDNDMARK